MVVCIHSSMNGGQHVEVGLALKDEEQIDPPPALVSRSFSVYYMIHLPLVKTFQYQSCQASLLLMCSLVWGFSYESAITSDEQQAMKVSLLKCAVFTQQDTKLYLLSLWKQHKSAN